MNCKPYNEFRNEYLHFVAKHFYEIKVREDWDRVIRGMKEFSADELAYRSEILADHTKNVTWGIGDPPVLTISNL